MDGWLLLAVIAGVTAGFASERLRPDLVAAMGLAALLVLGVLPVELAFVGLSSPATVTVACMFVLSAGLVSTGVVRYAGDRLLRHGPRSEAGLLLLVAFMIAPLSAFINNTAAVVIFMPIVLQACRGLGLSPSRLLMPMAFMAILGGTCTLIGTSTNILVASMAADRGVEPFRMFEFAPLGVIWVVVGGAYLVLIGRRLLVPRVAPGAATSGYDLAPFLSEVRVLPGSPLAGQTLAQARLRARHGLQVLAIQRRDDVETHPALDPNEVLREGDLLLVKASGTDLLRLSEEAGIRVRTGKHLGLDELRSTDARLVEALVAPNSWLVGQTLKEADFRKRYGATALAIHRRGAELREKIGRITLREGDELLVLADETALERLQRQRDFIVLQQADRPGLQPVKALIAAGIVAGVVTAAATGLYPVQVAALVGCVAMVLSGCLPLERLYESVDWRVVMLLATIIPFGLALETTGMAALIVERLLDTVGRFGPVAMLATFVCVTYLLTGFVSNNATAALMVPLVIGAAQSMAVSPRPFLVGVAFAASAAFYTPVGYQTNLLVYAPGGYRFTDYTRVGAPLNLVFVLLSVVVIPRLFPF